MEQLKYDVAVVGSGIGGLHTIEKNLLAYMKRGDEKGPSKITPFLIPMLIVNMASGCISIEHGLKGPNSACVTACASGNHAIGDAFKIIQRGDADIMVAGGAEGAITTMGFGGFCSLKALSLRNDEPEKASRPFDMERDGFVIGEGAGIIVLEEYERAKKRSAPIYCEITGYGMSADAYHITAPDPSGDGAKTLFQNAGRLWKRLGEEDIAIAYETIWKFADSPDMAIPFLSKKLEAPATGTASLKQLITRLDHNEYALRKQATEDLARLDRVAEPALQEAMKAKPSLEARLRIRMLLEACKKPLLDTLVTRRMVRGVLALEAIDDARARRVLERLASGNPRSRATHLAVVAMARVRNQLDYATKFAGKLRYEVQPERGKIKLDGSVGLRTRIINKSDVPVLVFYPCDRAYEGLFRFVVTRQDGVKVKIYASMSDALSSENNPKLKHFREIAPGKSISYKIFLGPIMGLNCQTCFFRWPGKYTIQPSLAISVMTARDTKTGKLRNIPGAWSGTLKASPVNITVVADPIELAKGVQLDGVAVGPNGKPVAGASVIIQHRVKSAGSLRGYGMSTVDRIFTDAQGCFSLSRLPNDGPSLVLCPTEIDR